MITVTMDVANAPRCVYCKRRILSAFVHLPAVRDRSGRVLYTLPTHAGCADLAHSGLTGDALATAQAAQVAMLEGLEAQVRQWQGV